MGRLLASLLRPFLAPMRRAAVERLGEIGPTLREETATSLGLASKGAGQVRGTGTLALTRDELAFAQWKPAGLLRIPRSAITSVGTTRAHLGKTVRRDLLLVHWTAGGADDSIALVVNDLASWHRALAP